MAHLDSHKFYTASIKKYGLSPRGVHWNSQKSQELRFEALLNLLPNHVFTLGDAGCGFGDLYLYMKKHHREPQRYVGIDSFHKMCAIASKRTACKIVLADICTEELPPLDYYICSGALNILTKFETYQFIRNCYIASNHGFIFNALYGTKESKTYNYISMKEIKKIALELEVKEVMFKEGYLENDITVGFFK